MLEIFASIICAILALGVGRSVILWAIAGYFLGFWALIPMLLLPIRYEKRKDMVKHQEEVTKFKKELKHL
jgi:ATP/ADP translocase